MSSATSLLLFNARSIKNKWTEIVAIADLNRADIFAVTETWLDSDSNLFAYNNFTCLYCNRIGNGGVLLQFSPHFQVEQLSAVDYPQTCELLAIRQKSDKRVWLLVNWPPDFSVEDTAQLCDAMSDIVVKVGKCAITVSGDFNAPTINWSNELTAPKLHAD